MKRKNGNRECDGDMNRTLENDNGKYRLSRKAGIFTQTWGNSSGNLEEFSHICSIKCTLCGIMSSLPLKALKEVI